MLHQNCDHSEKMCTLFPTHFAHYCQTKMKIKRDPRRKGGWVNQVSVRLMTMIVVIMMTTFTIMMIMIKLPWKYGWIDRTPILIDDRESRPRVLGHCHAVPASCHDDGYCDEVSFFGISILPKYSHLAKIPYGVFSGISMRNVKRSPILTVSTCKRKEEFIIL